MKHVLPLVVAFAAVFAAPVAAAYPDHPVKVIVPFAAGARPTSRRGSSSTRSASGSVSRS